MLMHINDTVLIVCMYMYLMYYCQIPYRLLSSDLNIFYKPVVIGISGPNMTPVDFFYVKVNSYLPSPAFSPTSCCLASVWHDRKSDTCTLRIAQIPSVTANGSPPLERHLADR